MGPASIPTITALRDALAMLADRYPHSRLGWGFSEDFRRWVLNSDLETVVVQRPWHDDISIGEALDAIATDETLRTPLGFVRYPNHLGLKVSHGLGDGLILHAIYDALLPTAMSGVPSSWFIETAPLLPLANAVCRTFGKNPLLVRKAFTDRPKLPPVQTSGAEAPWTPSRRTLHMAIPHADFDKIIAWAREHVPGANRAALQTSLMMRGLRASGLAFHPTVSMVVDLRRYLGGRPIDGNFVASVPFGFNADTSPDTIASIVKATMSSGRPLATHVLSTARMGSPLAPETNADPQGLPQLTFSTLGRLPGVGRVRFEGEGPEVYTASVEPAGPHGVTVLIIESVNTTQVTVNFNDNIVDADAVATALELVKGDPLNLLIASGGHR